MLFVFSQHFSPSPSYILSAMSDPLANLSSVKIYYLMDAFPLN